MAKFHRALPSEYRRQMRQKIQPTWALTLLLCFLMLALGYAWHAGSVHTHPNLYR